MRDREELLRWCQRLDGGPYPAYRDLRGRFDLQDLEIELLRVQPDPYAGPSRLRLRVPFRATALDPSIGDLAGGSGCSRPGLVDRQSARALAIRDFLGRTVGQFLDREQGSPEREGRPPLSIDRYGQQVLDRSAVLLDPDGVEIRLHVDLPARGRRILGRIAATRLVDLPEQIVRDVLSPGRLDLVAMERHVATVEDFAFLQAHLEERGWLAFVADRSRLARRAGNDDRPLDAEPVVEFVSPPTLRETVDLPHAGTVDGLAILPGVTLLCGGGFHGKSTLLRALGAAVSPHVPGDGREQVATRPDVQSVRAEDGRAISALDLRPFIRGLPFDQPTQRMSTENASGSTSQAAAILEAIQGGSRFLLMDEDTSATNFMIRDPLMEELLEGHREPITPFLVQARTLFELAGVSTVLVMGGSGEYFRVADTVIVLDTYVPRDRTERALRIAAARAPVPVSSSAAKLFEAATSPERPLPHGPSPKATDRGRARGRGKTVRMPRIRALDPRSLLIDRIPLDLQGVEALRDLSQARFLGRVLGWRFRELSSDGSRVNLRVQTVSELEAAVKQEWDRAKVDGFDPELKGDLAAVRVLEILAAVNRLRSRAAPGQDWGLTEGRAGTRNPEGAGDAPEVQRRQQE